MNLRKIGPRPSLWIAFGLGTGLVPRAPGTVGTLLGIPLVIVIGQVPGAAWQLVILVALFVFGCQVCQHAANWLDKKDPGAIVFDEIVGYCVAMALVPITPATMIVAFVLFRIADIFKPWPIAWIDRKVGGGIGIMADDLVAGILVNLVIHVLIYVHFLPV